MAPLETGKLLVTLNGAPREIRPANIRGLLQEIGRDPDEQGIAVAVNDAVVPRSEWANVRIQSGDTIEVVAARQGG
jgi:sulfur carrier protein